MKNIDRRSALIITTLFTAISTFVVIQQKDEARKSCQELHAKYVRECGQGAVYMYESKLLNSSCAVCCK